MREHFIVCGLGKIGGRVLEQLRAAGAAVVAIDNRCAADDPRLCGVPLIAGDCREADVLRRAGIEHARGVLILTSEDLVSLSTALMVRQLNPTIRVVVRLFNQSLITRLGSAMGNMQALSASALAAPLLALIARTGKTAGLMRLAQGRRRQITDIVLGKESPFVGRRLDEFGREYEMMIVAHHPSGQAVRMLSDVNAGVALAAHDRLVVCGTPERVAALSAGGESDSMPDLLWAGLVKRLSRVVARAVAMVDWPVKVCAAIFFTVVVASVIVFHSGMKDDGVVDAFYRTISLLATGADMHGDEVERGSWQKAFISSLRLVGTALTAAFTAIFTNYLIRANLGGALEVRRIPESGHIVVCGLGNVGFRVVEELIGQGEPVVVIESNAANSFISAARRLGAAVIVGNATVAQVLRQAHAASARAVVTVTSNDLVNLEISLLVREANSKQRVVLRLIDAQLAATLRQSANVRLAVSIPELAAPAFVAALYGDQVRSIFQVEGRMLAVFDLSVQDDESDLRELPLQELILKHRLAPLEWTSASGAVKSLLPTATLAAGDCLTALVTLENLQELLLREMDRTEAAHSATSSA